MAELKRAASGVAAPKTAGERKETRDQFPVTSYHGGARPSSGIAALLGHGPEHGITASRLADIMGVTVRDLRRIVASERMAGRLILADRKHGLFLPSEQPETATAEITAFITVSERQCRAQLATLKAARQALTTLPGQQRIGEVSEI